MKHWLVTLTTLAASLVLWPVRSNAQTAQITITNESASDISFVLLKDPTFLEIQPVDETYPDDKKNIKVLPLQRFNGSVTFDVPADPRATYKVMATIIETGKTLVSDQFTVETHDVKIGWINEHGLELPLHAPPPEAVLTNLLSRLRKPGPAKRSE